MFPFFTNDIFEILYDLAAKELKARPRLRVTLLWLSILALLVAGSIYLITRQILVSVGVGVPGLAILGVVGFSYTEVSAVSIVGEVSSLRQEREQLTQRIDEGAADPYSNLQLNLNLLRQYYLQSVQQAKSSFRLGVLTVVVGMGALIAGVVLLFTHKDAVTAGTVATIAGSISQFIAATSFWLFRSAIRQQEQYFEQLAALQRLMLAVTLGNEITGDVQLQNKTRRDLAIAIAEGAIRGAGSPSMKGPSGSTSPSQVGP